MRKPVAVLSSLALTLTTHATAQVQPDFTQIGSAVNGLAFPVTMNMCNAGSCGPQRAPVARRRGSTRIPPTEEAPRPIAPNGPVSIGTYQPSSALAKRTVAAYVERIRRTNPAVADQVAREFDKHDYQAVYRTIVEASGFRPYSVSDSMAAYMMMAWLIANGGTREPSRAEAAGLRRQFAARVAGDRTVLANRAKLSEELKLLLVALNAGFQSSRRDGTQRQYSDDVAAMVRKQYDLDLRALRLSSDGFVDRG
jgi:hypothetical protein